MRTCLILPFAVLAVGAASHALAQSPASIKGMYVEMRGSIERSNCSARVGQTSARVDDCVVLVWKVASGSFRGVPLDGLAMIAIRQPGASDGTRNVRESTVLLLDRRADSSQRAALGELAARLAGKSLGNVIAERVEDIDVRIGEGCAHGYAWLDSPTIQARTRPTKQRLASIDLQPGDPRGPLAETYYDYRAESVACQWQEVGAEWISSELIHDDAAAAFVGGFWIDPSESDRSRDHLATR
jgi:hypothetical protein